MEFAKAIYKQRNQLNGYSQRRVEGSFQGFDRSGKETTEFTYFSAAYARSVEQIGLKQVSSEVTLRESWRGAERRRRNMES